MREPQNPMTFARSQPMNTSHCDSNKLHATTARAEVVVFVFVKLALGFVIVAADFPRGDIYFLKADRPSESHLKHKT